ncbi:hypothetical protein HY642_04960, partial [Candidatus Woesearchaeota archaeon]|nr:hypothetical protein [Candidatus Woesearchaeota archaeon]
METDMHITQDGRGHPTDHGRSTANDSPSMAREDHSRGSQSPRGRSFSLAKAGLYFLGLAAAAFGGAKYGEHNAQQKIADEVSKAEQRI